MAKTSKPKITNQIAYKQHLPEEAVAAQVRPIESKPGKKGKRTPSRKKMPALSESKNMTTEEVTLTAFRLIYESYHPESHA